MQTYASAYRNKTYKDIWNSEEEQGFVSEADYNAHKNKMLKSAYEQGGFWISQYEIGYEEETLRTEETNDAGLIQKPVSKEGTYPYIYVTCKQAQKLATQMGSNEYTTSLMFGIQWDLVMKHMEVRGKKPQKELATDSTNWGNYFNSNFNITKGKYSEDYGKTFISVNEKYPKATDKEILITTGTTEKNSCLNIYDIAGNVREWTLEYKESDTYPCASRGGSYHSNGDNSPASYRLGNRISNATSNISFRTALYK